ncbi:MAG TPA: hypothetical protein VK826_19510 [Bacteroidia bacterium]|nr:hypothetical protein [Bacteroidia bacterium]
MSSTIYNKAFEAELSHAFYVYTDAPLNNEFKVNKDITIVPTIECKELMRQGRIRFVPTLKGFTTFYQAYIDGNGNQQPLVKLPNGVEFTFAVFLDPAAISLFLNVTDLDIAPKTYSAGKFLMLEQTINDATPPPPVTSALTASLANSLRGSLFTYSFQSSVPLYTGDAEVVVSLGVSDVLIIEGIPYNPITKGYSVEINLRDQPKGFYTLKAYDNTATEIDSNDFYVDADLAVNNAFGLIKIKYTTVDRLYDTTSDVTSFTAFQYEFDVREVLWRYYIVAANLDSAFFAAFDLKVIKVGGAYTFFASYPGTPFSQANGKPDPAVAINGKATVILQSTAPIPYSEGAQLEFDLWKKAIIGGAETKMISNLPNPNAQGIDADQWGAAQTPPTITPGISEIFVFV